MNECRVEKGDEMDLLASEWMDGVLEDEGKQKLQEMLRQSSDLRKRFLDLVHTDTLAEQALKSEQLIADPVLPVDTILVEQRRHSVKIALLAAAAVVLMGVMLLSLFLAPEREPGQLAFRVSEGSRFTLTHDSTHDELPKGQTLVEGSRLELSQGSVELRFASGVRSVIMAPADVVLRHEGLLSLDRGTAWFDVPENAKGFTVQTTQMKVVDLGTQFGVSSQPGEELDQVHVFKGKVKALARRGQREEVLLEAGQARELEPTGRMKMVDCHPDQFLDSLPKTLPYLHWSFDSLEDDVLQVGGTHPEVSGLQTRLYSPDGGAQLVPGKSGQALYLDGEESYVVTNWEGFDGDRPRTMAFWLKVPELPKGKNNYGLVGWGDNRFPGGKWALSVRRSGKAKYGDTVQLLLNLGKGMVTVANGLESGRWHHVALSYSGALDQDDEFAFVQAYVDGERVQTQAAGIEVDRKINTTIHSKSSQPLVMGVRVRKDKNIAERRYFKGMMDELYIFDGSLDDVQIRSLINP
ncbi:FecR domain-containing protein [Verrucomicrobiaceae bacterium N1E253]|uniref:FecR domain-containing protein n=1 Tax=Oceaniferula marina TaxID=2748318 RepID=A0A851GJ13_9BACT|nr:LamG-like jellyroll fold domain-containing protein [Oceaniferula marina]NWK55861.1 FecR domain-containing protein [Oceaniferula marina]